MSEFDDYMLRAKQQLKDLPAQIDERRKDFDKVSSISPTEFTKFECDRLNKPLNPEIEFDSDNKEKTLEEIRDQYKERLSGLEKDTLSYKQTFL